MGPVIPRSATCPTFHGQRSPRRTAGSLLSLTETRLGRMKNSTASIVNWAIGRKILLLGLASLYAVLFLALPVTYGALGKTRPSALEAPLSPWDGARSVGGAPGRPGLNSARSRELAAKGKAGILVESDGRLGTARTGAEAVGSVFSRRLVLQKGWQERLDDVGDAIREELQVEFRDAGENVFPPNGSTK